MSHASRRGERRPVTKQVLVRCRLLVLTAALFSVSFSRAEALDASLLVPQPRSATTAGCHGDHVVARGLRLPPSFGAGARSLLDERWGALGMPRTQTANAGDVAVRIAPGPPEAYTLRIPTNGTITIRASDAEGVFDAAMTLAQLARPAPQGLRLSCVRIEDAPALRWRIVSDDVSRGPLPTMRYFKERIRGLAALKINGYSIYMEHVFVAAAHPCVAPADGITPQQLRELNDYAARFHVALIPEQQTLAHMHGTLRWEQLSAPAEISHGWTFAPVNPQTYAYLTSLLREVLTAAGK